MSRVEKLRPHTTVPAICTHHSEPGGWISMRPVRKPGSTWNISGSRPITVTTVVSSTGRKRWIAARTAASASGRPFRLRL